MKYIDPKNCPKDENGRPVLPVGYALRRPDRRPPSQTPPKQSTKATTKKASANRFEVLNRFVDWSMADLTRAEIAVWLILFRDTRDGIAKTSQTDIANRGGLSRQHVSRAIQGLKKRGLLKVVYQGAFRRGVSWYRVLGHP